MSATVENKKQAFLANFTEDKNTVNVAKQEALKALENLEFPTTREEYWKYTRVGKIVNQKYPSASLTQVKNVEKYSINNLDTYCAVFINGIFSEEQSNIGNCEGVTISTLAQAADQAKQYYGNVSRHKTQFFAALNAAYSANGIFVKVEKNTAVDKPIHVIHITNADDVAVNTRNIFVVEDNAQATFINTFDTEQGNSFTNAAAEIYVKSGAHVDSYLIQNESEASKQVNAIDVIQEANSTYSCTTLTFDGGLVRNNHNVDVKGQGCETNLFGLYLTDRDQHVDNHTIIDHIEPNCESNEFYIGVMDDKSTAVFNGKVFVRAEAQKTNAFQQNKNMLLTDNASAYSKPELEIYADDVKCSHGSTTGQVDEEAVYYLRSRGVSETNARKMMIRAFANEILENIKIDALRDTMETKIDQRFI
jgi:Fe-S cluster assembly protein SufD